MPGRIVECPRCEKPVAPSPDEREGADRKTGLGGFVDPGDGFVRRPQRIGDVAEVDQCGEIAVTFGKLGRCGRIAHNGNLEALFQQFDNCESESKKLIEADLPLPAYEMMLKSSHLFNLLDARNAISVTERARFIGRIRSLSRAVAQAYYERRESLGFPMLGDAS